MDFPSYIMRILYDNQQSADRGGIFSALQRFLVENTYAIHMARQRAEMMQNLAAEQAHQQASVLGNIPAIGGLLGQAAFDQSMANATAAGDAMVAAAAGDPSMSQQPTIGWEEVRSSFG